MLLLRAQPMWPLGLEHQWSLPRKHTRPYDSSDSQMFDRLTPVSRQKQGRHGGKYTEEQEDADMLKDNTQSTHRLTTQPSCIKHGNMREYQIQGLNWLIHLYDNGINGILADEMVRLAP